MRARALPWLLLLLATGAHAQPARVLTLQEAEAIARERQPQLRSAEAGTQAARARADQSRAGLLPQLNASASALLDTDNRAAVTLPGTGGGLATSRRFSVGLSASQLLYDFGRTSRQWRAAQQSAQAQGAFQRQTLQDVLLDVRTSYFDALTEQALLAVARETLQSEEARLRQVDAAVQVGSRPEIDVLQQRTARANAQVQLIQAQGASATARARLNQAMGLEGSTDYTLQEVSVAPLEGEEAPLEALVAQALQARADVVALERQVRAQELQLGAERGGYWPSLSATVSAGGVGEDPRDATLSATGALTLSWPLFEGGRTRAGVRAQEATLRDVQAQRDGLRQQVRLEVESARLAVASSREALGAAGEARVNARERLRLAEGRYRAGVGNILELGDAQVAYTSAAAQHSQATYALASSRAQLALALGTEGLSAVAAR